jgi:hypothetical protein
MTPFTVWLVFCLLVLLLSLVKPNVGRIFVGFFFLAMALGVNVVMVLLNPESYIGLGANSFIPFYRWVFLNTIVLNPPLFVLPVAAFQITIAMMMLGKGRYVKWGLLAGIAFLLGITPLGTETLANPVMALALAALLRKTYDRSVLDMLRSHMPRRQLPKAT